MALMQTVAVNLLICSACRVAVAPKLKDDGGIAFPLELVHQIAKTKCSRYASVEPAPIVTASALTREERRQARWAERIERRETQRIADAAREQDEYQAFLDAGPAYPDFPDQPESTDLIALQGTVENDISCIAS